MPEGMPPVPRTILSRKRLRETWGKSRDASTKPASAGIDYQTAQSFAQKFDVNIDRLHSELMDKKFHFSKLKPVPIPKDNGKIRVICIPTVRDRLVQRAMVTWLVETKKIPQQDFVYGIKGKGAKLAIERAIGLRQTYDWCLKTDIQAFFDKIHRGKLKSLIEQKLRGSSLLPLLFAAVDQEVKFKNIQQAKEVSEAGITPGIGVRQGMPLSPLLANFSLSRFDAACKSHNIKILRYADDILAFFHTKTEAQAGFEHIKAALKSLELMVPDIGDAKTDLISPKQPVRFLGREIVFLDTENRYVSRLGDKKLQKIKEELSKEYSLSAAMEEGTLNDAISSLAASIRSYLGSYKDAYDFSHFNSEIRGHFKAITSTWFKEIFGGETIEKLSEDQRKFLGIQIVENLDPSEDLEITS